MRIPLPSLLLFIVACSLFAVRADAALVFSDEFVTGGSPNYTIGVNLSTQNPTVLGATGAWAGASTSQWRPNDTNLTVPGVTNGGGALRYSVGNGVTSSSSQNRQISTGSSTETLWFGGIFQASNVTGTAAGLETMAGFLNQELPQTSVATSTGAIWNTANGGALQGFGFGIRNGFLAVDYQTDIALASGSRTVTQVTTSFDMTGGGAFFLVARVDFSAIGDETLNIWALTSAPADVLSLGTATYSVTANFSTDSALLDTLNVWTGKNGTSGTTTNAIDALRIGTSYSDLIAVPEPSTFALLGLGMMTALLRRRRR